jgi:hypothetical protein
MADRYRPAYIRRLTDEYRRDLETVQFLFSLHIWTPPLCIFDAATSHSPAAHQPSSPPSHRHRRLAASSVPRQGPSFTCPPSSSRGHVICAPPSFPDVAAPWTPHSTPPLAPPLPCRHSSRMPPGPPSRSPVHWYHAGPCAGCHRATESGATGATRPPSWAPLEPPTPSHGPSSQTPPGPPSCTPVHYHRAPAAPRTPDAQWPPAGYSPLSTASLWPTTHRRK